MGLIADVQLLDVDKKYSKPIPPMTNFDCIWIEDPLVLEKMEESIKNKPIFASWFYRNLLKKIEGNESENMISALQEKLL